jgi:hypothetical protein
MTVNLRRTCGVSFLTLGENALYETKSQDVETLEAQIPEENYHC